MDEEEEDPRKMKERIRMLEKQVNENKAETLKLLEEKAEDAKKIKLLEESMLSEEAARKSIQEKFDALFVKYNEQEEKYHREERDRGIPLGAKTIGEIFRTSPKLCEEQYLPSLFEPGSAANKSSSGSKTEEKYAPLPLKKNVVVKWEMSSFFAHLRVAEDIVLESCDGVKFKPWEKLVELKVPQGIELRMNGQYEEKVKLGSEVDITFALLEGPFSTMKFAMVEIFRGTGVEYRTMNSPQGPSPKPSLDTLFRVDIFIEIFDHLGNHAMIIQENKLPWKFPDRLHPPDNLEKEHLVTYYIENEKRLDQNVLKQIRMYMAVYQRQFGIITSLNCFTFLRLRDDEVLEVSDRFWIDQVPGKMGLLEILFRWIFASLKNNIIRRPKFLEVFLSNSGIKEYKKRDYLKNYKPGSFHLSRSDEDEDEEEEYSGTTSTQCKPSCWADLEDPCRVDLPAEQQLTPLGTFPGDAKLLTRSRVGDVYLKEWDGVKIVSKLLALDVPRGKDGPKTSELILEMEREAVAYQILKELQGDIIPNFIRYGCLIPEYCDVLSTEYAGEAIQTHTITPKQYDEAKMYLGAIHALGVSHGDLSNARNLLLNEYGHIVFVDFGFAKFRSELTKEEWEIVTKRDIDDLRSLCLMEKKRPQYDTSGTVSDDEMSCKRTRYESD